MSGIPVSKLPDDDMQAAPAALVRAGLKARELARKTGTAVVIVRNGILVEESVDDSPQPANAPMASLGK
jgi:hypothetical protein